MFKIVSYALAKVNLTLKITGKASDGYHNMESIFLFLPDIYDTLTFDLTREFSEDSAKIASIPDQANSIKKAAQLLRSHFNLPIPHVDIIKKIPTEAGLGGGSSDCACFIDSVFNIWNLDPIEKFNFIHHAKPLGSDAIVFLHKYFLNTNTLFLKGTGLDGEIINISLPELHGAYALLINNGTKLSTKEVFSKYAGSSGENSLEQPAIFLEPSISEILEDLKLTSPVLFRMSGSGTTCFGIYESEEKAISSKEKLSKIYEFVEISIIAQ